MKSIGISSIEIDGSGRLLVYPAVQDPAYLQYVYRAAAEIYWDNAGYFHSPIPREWSYCQWLEQIRFAVRDELGIELVALQDTSYISVPKSDELAMRLALGQRA